jgi:hypothetical protein
LAHLLGFDRLTFVDKGGVARNDEQARQLGEVGDDSVGDAVAEISTLKPSVFSSDCHLKKQWFEVISVCVANDSQRVRRVKFL